MSLRSYVPATPAGRAFAFIALVDSTGTGLYLAGATVFFVRVVGLSTAQVGTGLAIAGVVGFLATVPLGILVDRYGARRLLVILHSWRAAWFVALAFAIGPVAFVLISACLALSEHSVSPTTQAVVAGVVGDQDRTRTLATMRSVRNVGFCLGAGLAAPLLGAHSLWSYRVIMLGDALSFVVAVALLLRLRVTQEPAAIRRSGPVRFVGGFTDWRYLGLAGLNGILALHMTLLSVAMPLWVISATRAPVAVIPLLVALNTVMAVLLQVPFSRGSDEPAFGARALRRAGVVLAGCCLALAAAGYGNRITAIGLLVLGVGLMTCGELWQSVGGWELSYRYAVPARRGEYLSIFSLGVTLQEILGPLLAIVVVNVGRPGWVLLASVFGLAIALVRPAVGALERARAVPEDEAAPVG